MGLEQKAENVLSYLESLTSTKLGWYFSVVDLCSEQAHFNLLISFLFYFQSQLDRPYIYKKEVKIA